MSATAERIGRQVDGALNHVADLYGSAGCPARWDSPVVAMADGAVMRVSVRRDARETTLTARVAHPEAPTN